MGEVALILFYVIPMIASFIGAIYTSDDDEGMYFFMGLCPGLNLVSCCEALKEFPYKIQWRDDEDIDQPTEG